MRLQNISDATIRAGRERLHDLLSTPLILLTKILATDSVQVIKIDWGPFILKGIAVCYTLCNVIFLPMGSTYITSAG